MKKDIKFEPVTGVMLAIVPQNPTNLEEPWEVVIINKNLIELENVMIVSKGYGTIGAEKKTTSTLRHVIPRLESQSFSIVEPVLPALFSITNEYWVSYYILNQIFDKKFTFVPESIQKSHLTHIHELEKQGVLHS
jgi:hypothetical protein